MPVFDIAPLYEAKDQQDMLVNNKRLGAALASEFAEDNATRDNSPDHSVVLMRQHGFTTHGPDIPTAVYRAIYTQVNAEAQTKSTLLRDAVTRSSDAKPTFAFEALTAEQCSGCQAMNERTKDRPWGLWVREVEKCSLYTNRG